MSFTVMMEVAFADPHGRGPAPEELAAVLDAVMEQLVQHDAVDPDIGADLGAGTAEISVTVEGDEPVEVFGGALALVRTAVHAAGIGTPGWEIDWRRVNLERPELVDA
jgi:hypothetical protein